VFHRTDLDGARFSTRLGTLERDPALHEAEKVALQQPERPSRLDRDIHGRRPKKESP